MSEHWFNSTPDIDATIQARFASVWEQAQQGQFDDWQNSAEGCLEAKSFATEQQAVAMTKHAVAQGFDKQLATDRLMFLYMPLMHSEHMVDQDESVRLFEAAGLEDNARFAQHHRHIVERFGRFPHRNEMLGRKSSADELAYLASDEAFTG